MTADYFRPSGSHDNWQNSTFPWYCPCGGVLIKKKKKKKEKKNQAYTQLTHPINAFVSVQPDIPSYPLGYFAGEIYNNNRWYT